MDLTTKSLDRRLIFLKAAVNYLGDLINDVGKNVWKRKAMEIK